VVKKKIIHCCIENDILIKKDTFVKYESILVYGHIGGHDMSVTDRPERKIIVSGDA